MSHHFYFRSFKQWPGFVSAHTYMYLSCSLAGVICVFCWFCCSIGSLNRSLETAAFDELDPESVDALSGLNSYQSSIPISLYYIYITSILSLSLYLYPDISISLYTYLYISISLYLYLYISITVSLYLYPCISRSLSLYLCTSISLYLYTSIFLYLYPCISIPVSLSLYIYLFFFINNSICKYMQVPLLVQATLHQV